MVNAINLVLLMLMGLIFLRAALSFFRISPESPMYRVAETTTLLTEPVLGPVRRMLPPMGGFDLSPLIVLILISLLRQMISSF